MRTLGWLLFVILPVVSADVPAWRTGCKFQLEDIKSIIDTTHFHRVSCEDAKFKGPHCINYWRSVQELVYRQMNYQRCTDNRDDSFENDLTQTLIAAQAEIREAIQYFEQNVKHYTDRILSGEHDFVFNMDHYQNSIDYMSQAPPSNLRLRREGPAVEAFSQGIHNEIAITVDGILEGTGNRHKHTRLNITGEATKILGSISDMISRQKAEKDMVAVRKQMGLRFFIQWFSSLENGMPALDLFQRPNVHGGYLEQIRDEITATVVNYYTNQKLRSEEGSTPNLEMENPFQALRNADQHIAEGNYRRAFRYLQKAYSSVSKGYPIASEAEIDLDSMEQFVNGPAEI